MLYLYQLKFGGPKKSTVPDFQNTKVEIQAQTPKIILALDSNAIRHYTLQKGSITVMFGVPVPMSTG